MTDRPTAPGAPVGAPVAGAADPGHTGAPAAPRPHPSVGRRRALAVVLVACVAALAATATAVAVRGDGGARPAGAWTLVPYQGLGAWVDVYDWTDALGGPDPAVGVDELDEMADAGVQTVFLQTAHHRIPGALAEPDRLATLIDRAHENGMSVVAWYLPTLVDVEVDLQRLRASADLDVDGLGVDIESIEVEDPATRTARLLELTDRLRAELGPDRALSAITLTPVHLEVLNPAYWPGYPWAELGRAYDVIQPMTYWTIRTGELRSGRRYVAENLERLRELAGPEVPLHPVGGIADGATEADLDGMLAAAEAETAIGGSLYDWATSSPAQWEQLAPLRALRDQPPDGG